MKQTIHEHNDAIQEIDKKINSLVLTIGYLSDCNGGAGGTVFTKSVDEVYNRIKSLKKSKSLLLSFDSSEEDELLQKSPTDHFNRPVEAYDENGELFGRYESISFAELATGVNRRSISLICQKRQKKSHYGYTFKFI